MKKLLLILCSLVSLAAAAERWYFPVSKLERGLVHLPEKPLNIMVVNNAVNQPANYGHQRSLCGQQQKALVQPQDSSIFFCILSASEAMENSGSFQSVSLYDQSCNQSDRFFELDRLTPERARQLCKDYQTDALLVLNRLVIVSERQSIHEDIYYLTALDLRSMANWTYYTDIDDFKLHNFTVCDTLSWETQNSNHQYALDQLPQLSEAVLETAIRAGERACRTLFAHPVDQYRYVFSNRDENIQKGFALIRRQNWNEAITALTPAINARGITAAYASADIALCLEMMGDQQQAAKFAQQALDIFLHSNKQEATESALVMKWYLNILQPE